MSALMKAVIIEQYGGREVLKLSDLPRPEPREGEVLVRILAAGVNPVDWKIRAGYLQQRMPSAFPITLGWDLAGIVEERGLGARRFEAGDKVYAYARKNSIHDGTYAEYIALPESYLSLKPKNITFEKAAAVPLAGLTAYQVLADRAALKKGQTCVIVGASGGVGSFAVQFARLLGARVIAVASRKNHAYLRFLGAQSTIDYVGSGFVEGVRKILPQGADVVFSPAGGESLKKAFDCAKKGGKLLTISEPGDPELAKAKGIQLIYHFVEPNSRQLDLFRGWIEKGKLKVNVSKVYPLEEAAKAHEAIESGHTRGKIVLKI
jgi:NADPH:quinone reductase-like Zn-dependent oxidoreductase